MGYISYALHAGPLGYHWCYTVWAIMLPLAYRHFSSMYITSTVHAQHWWIAAWTQCLFLGLANLWMTCPSCLIPIVMTRTLVRWLSTPQFEGWGLVYICGWLPLTGCNWTLRGPAALKDRFWLCKGPLLLCPYAVAVQTLESLPPALGVGAFGFMMDEGSGDPCSTPVSWQCSAPTCLLALYVQGGLWG